MLTFLNFLGKIPSFAAGLALFMIVRARSSSNRVLP